MAIKLSEIRKFLVALLGFASAAVSNNMLSGTALRWTNLGIAFVTTALVWFVPNDQPATPPSTPLL